MRYALPIVLAVALAAYLAVAPHIEPIQLRARARRVHEELRARHGFGDGSKAAWGRTRATGWPPFHYGKRQVLDGELVGTVSGQPVRVVGYEVVFNGWRHRYGLAAVVLPRPLDWVEVRGERPFCAARVADHVPDGQLTLGVPDFDADWAVYAETPDAVLLAGSRETATAMLALPTRFSWRVHENEALLWKRDGWTSAAQLLVCVSSVLALLGYADAGLLDPAS